MYQIYGCFLKKLKKFFIVLIFSVALIIVSLFLVETWLYISDEHNFHTGIVYQFYFSRKSWITSNLGSILFKDVTYKDFYQQKPIGETFTILIWQYNLLLNDPTLPNLNYSKTNPLDRCAVKNCILTNDENNLYSADAVVVNLNKGSIPSVKGKKSYQRWIFWTQKLPSETLSHKLRLEMFKNVFNWSMSYLTTSDVPIPFGRTIPQPGPVLTNDDVTLEKLLSLIPFWQMKQRDVLISAVVNDCNFMQYVEKLAKYVDIDVFGNCSTDLPKKSKIRCTNIPDCLKRYLFTIAFEEDSCIDYITEKTFYYAYAMGAIPIIVGTSTSNCITLLPEDSFLQYHYYSMPNLLAKDVIEISQGNARLLDYHVWRNYFKVVNEHGFYDTNAEHYCRICEALNYNDPREKVYGIEELKAFLSPHYNCV